MVILYQYRDKISVSYFSPAKTIRLLSLVISFLPLILLR